MRHGSQVHLLPAAVLWQLSKLHAMLLLQACGPESSHGPEISHCPSSLSSGAWLSAEVLETTVNASCRQAENLNLLLQAVERVQAAAASVVLTAATWPVSLTQPMAAVATAGRQLRGWLDGLWVSATLSATL